MLEATLSGSTREADGRASPKAGLGARLFDDILATNVCDPIAVARLLPSSLQKNCSEGSGTCVGPADRSRLGATGAVEHGVRKAEGSRMAGRAVDSKLGRLAAGVDADEVTTAAQRAFATGTVIALESTRSWPWAQGLCAAQLVVLGISFDSAAVN